MLNSPLRLSDVVKVQGSLSWQESIALVQSIVAASESGRAEAREPSGTIADDFVLCRDGTVAPTGDVKRAVSISELALFLGQLLPAESPGAKRPPAGIKFTIARSLGLVEAPPIANVSQLSATLRRFENQDRMQLLAALYERCTSPRERPQTADRRERRPSQDAFRRLLREADERAWSMSQAAAAQHFDDRVSATRVDVLRRFLREADERNYLLVAALRARPSASQARAGGSAARRRQLQTGIGVIALVAAAAVAEQYQAAARRPSNSPARLGTRTERSSLSTSLGTAPAVPPTAHEPTALSRPEAGPRRVAARGSARPPGFGVMQQRTAALDAPAQGGGQMVEALDVNRKPIFSPSFSADGSAVFFDNGSGSTSAVMTAQRVQPGRSASAADRLRVVSLVDDGARNYHPHLSPDGRMLAFDSDRDGERGVYVADRDGRHVRRVSGPGYAAVPTWSPDSRRLAFVRAETDRPAVWNVWVLDVARGTETRVTDYRYGQPWGASWFPDGRRICYAHEDALVVLDLPSGRSRSYPSPQPGRLVRTPAVSPNGRLVVFQLYRDGVWLLDLTDASMRRILADPSAEEFAWTPDGRQVAFHSRRSGDWGVWFMAPEP